MAYQLRARMFRDETANPCDAWRRPSAADLRYALSPNTEGPRLPETGSERRSHRRALGDTAPPAIAGWCATQSEFSTLSDTNGDLADCQAVGELRISVHTALISKVLWYM